MVADSSCAQAAILGHVDSNRRGAFVMSCTPSIDSQNYEICGPMLSAALVGMLALGLGPVWAPRAGKRKSAHGDGPDQPQNGHQQ